MRPNAGAMFEAVMVVDRPWWHPYARCIDQVDLFYDPSRPAVAAALDVCRLCGVREQCLAEALAEEEGRRWKVFGVRGGLTPTQRRQLLLE